MKLQSPITRGPEVTETSKFRKLSYIRYLNTCENFRKLVIASFNHDNNNICRMTLIDAFFSLVIFKISRLVPKRIYSHTQTIERSDKWQEKKHSNIIRYVLFHYFIKIIKIKNLWMLNAMVQKEFIRTKGKYFIIFHV